MNENIKVQLIKEIALLHKTKWAPKDIRAYYGCGSTKA